MEANGNDGTRRSLAASDRPKGYEPEPIHKRGRFFIGIDIGSTSSDVVVLDEAGRVFLSDYQRTKGRPVETAYEQLRQVFRQINLSQTAFIAVTGAAGRFLARLLEIVYVNEIPAQAEAICHLYPHLEQATVIEMGGQDSKLIFLLREGGVSKVRDFALNTVCAAGTGSFLDQQAQRLGVNIEDEFGRLALESRSAPRMAGRCSVFAKSDMIHLQQQATPTYDIIAGLCMALARNLKSNLGCGREFVKPIVFTGGVAANIGVVRALEKVFELSDGQLIVPQMHFFTGAIGAVLAVKKRGGWNSNGEAYLEKIDKYLKKRGSLLRGAPRLERLETPGLPIPESRVYEELLSHANGPINAYLGVDVGSISTNVVVMDEERRVLAKAYLMTAGRPLEAVRQGLAMVGEKVTARVKILGAATTGSGRYLTGDFIGADIVTNEITAQAAGAAIVNSKVDTIFEIGGQDSKYISLEDGVVVDFEMNHACAAGTGSFLEEQSQRLGININEEFAALAFESDRPIKLGERCTVFMESDLLSYQQQGAKVEELVAGLSYSIVANYLNRVVGRRRIGNNICFQGGTAFNKAVWSAFEKVTGKPIMVPDHHEVTGALGAASIAAEYMNNLRRQGRQARCKFRGFENLAGIEYSVESFNCDHCPNECEIKKVQLPKAEPLYYGSRCDRYNLKKEVRKSEGFDAFEYRREKLFEMAGLTEKEERQAEAKAKIGIPMALVNWQLLPLFSRFFKLLGFEVVLSGRTNKKIIRKGVESVTAQPCFPVKVAYGHIAELLEKSVDYIFLPSIVSMTAGYPENKRNQLCPYVQSLPYQAQTAFGDQLGQTKLLTTVIRMGEGKRLLTKSFISLGRKLGVPVFSAVRALKQSFAFQAEFERTMIEKGKELLRDTGEDEKLFVLVCRPYNGSDGGVNLELPKKLAALGVKAIPMDMLDLASACVGDDELHRNIYWTYGQKILRAAEIIKRDRRLFGIYLSNFSCGPDSFLMTFFKDIMSQKPCLQLELDEHSADAGVITRLEAFLDSLKHYRRKDEQERPAEKRAASKGKIGKGRKLYIPYMSDCSYGIAACFRSYGQASEVMPMADEASLLQGRQFTCGKECLPCAVTTGDMLKVLSHEEGKKVSFFMPGSSGPCRFGMYNDLHRLVLKYAGAGDAKVISPNQDSSLYKEFTETLNSSGNGNFMRDIWTSAIGIDLLGKVILRLRPFAKDRDYAQEVYDRAVKAWVRAVEEGSAPASKLELMESIAGELAAVELDYSLSKPKIGVVGEIYVRSHPFVNRNIISRLEELGAVCDLASLAEWIYYTNFTRVKKSGRTGRLKVLFANIVQNYFQKKIEKKLAEPLERRFGKLAEGPIEEVLELARPYLHPSFEGEAILSIGKTVEYYHHGAGGVVNVMPFGCMPSTVVSGYSMRVSGDCSGMPILNLSFDGQEDSTLTTRLEAFVEQVCQKQEGRLQPSQFVRV